MSDHSSAGRVDLPPGLLRVLVLFHEPESLGASTSVLRAVDELAWYGWSVAGWFPDHGPVIEHARAGLSAVHVGERSIAFSRRGWREPPGPTARARRIPAYLGDVRRALVRVRPHVVHANTLLALPEAAVARSCGLPLVLQAHELPPRTRKRAAAVRLAGRTADVLVAVSDAVAAMLRQGAGGTPVLTVRNGVPPSRVSASPGERPFTIGTVGTVSRTKGTDVFLRAARLVLERRPGTSVEHVGASGLHRDPGLDAEVAGLIAGAAGRITMCGALPAESVLGRWDAFVLSSRSEAFPLATLEAMAAGLPVIATSVGGVPEQIEHLVSGVLVPPDDPEAIAAWIVRLHDDPGLRRRLGAAAAARAAAEFTLSGQAAGLHRAYLTALNRRFGPPAVRARARTA